MDAIRIGIVGLGGICRQRHVPGLKKIAGVELVAVANRSRESGEQAAREFGIPEVAKSWEDIVGRDDLDAILIGTWPCMHRAVSMAALESGKHVFCQARMAMDYQEARAMHACAESAGRVAMLCPVPIGLSIDAAILRMLREGALGTVRLVRVQGLYGDCVDPAAPMHWRKDHRLSGLNVMTLGMYAEVINRWFGPARRVMAQTQVFTPTRIDGDGQVQPVKIPDQILFHTLMEGDVAVQYVISGMAPYGRDAIEIHGSEKTLHYDVNPDVLYEIGADGQQTRVSILPEDAYDVENWRVEQDFIDAIRKGKEYHPNFEDGLRYMQVVQAVHDSAATGRAIDLA